MVKVNKNKRLILLLVLILSILLLLIGILGGCGKKNLPDGIESKTFLKDMDKLYDIVLKSESERKYYKEDIDKILDKMNEQKYQEKLNDYEIYIYALAKETLPKVESDLTTGEKMIQGYTFDEVESIAKMLGYEVCR